MQNLQDSPSENKPREKTAHDAANEALSIVMGVQMLKTLPAESLTPQQQRAMKILEDSADRLVTLIEQIKGEKSGNS